MARIKLTGYEKDLQRKMQNKIILFRGKNSSQEPEVNHRIANLTKVEESQNKNLGFIYIVSRQKL